jgi:tetratricopeptide (TPR) repeat protein
MDIVRGRHSKWLERVVSLVRRVESPVGVVGTRTHGINYIVAELMSSGRFAWVQFDPYDMGDSASQGSKLADALSRVVGSNVVGHGLPVDYTMQMISRVSGGVSQLGFVFSNVQFAQEAMLALRHIANQTNIIVFGASQDAVGLARPSVVVDSAELLLRDEELEASCPGQLCVSASALSDIARQAGWCYLPFAVTCASLAGMPPVIVPEPTGASIEGSTTDVLDSARLIEALIRRGSHVDAFELAVRTRVVLSDAVVGSGAEALMARGLHGRLFRMLDGLDPVQRAASPELMKWYFASATAIDRHNDIKPEVMRFLAASDAPELRALFAAAYPGPELMSETKAALDARETPLTLRIHAFAQSQLSAGSQGADLLWKAMRHAEALGSRDQVMASATDLADYWIKRGGYREALEWSRWAIEYHSQHDLCDELRRMLAVGLGAYASMLIGEVEGLTEAVEQLDIAAPSVPTAEALVSTRADWLFLQGRLSDAASLYRLNLSAATLGQYPYAAVDLVHALASLGQTDAALAVATRARALARSSGDGPRAMAELAYGLAAMDRRPDEAAVALSEAQDRLLPGLESHKLAQASIALSIVHIRRGADTKAKIALDRGRHALKELGPSGWTLLGGFHQELDMARRLFDGGEKALELLFLGRRLVRINGAKVSLGTRYCEVLAVLAM